MIPSLDDRLDSVVRALRDVILPSLPPERPLAIEQAHLSLAQIGLVREQLDLAPAFERREAEAMLALADELLKVADGGGATSTAAADLRSAAATATLDAPKAVRAATYDVGAAIERLIDASYEDGSEAFRASSMEAVLAAGRTAAMMNRSWNRSAGFEASEAAVAAIDLI